MLTAKIQFDNQGFRLDASPEAFAHNAALLEKRAKEHRKEGYAMRRKGKRAEEGDIVKSGQLDGADGIEGQPGSEERISALRAYYESASEGESPFQISAGDMMLALVNIPDKVRYETFHEGEGEDEREYVREIRTPHPSKKAAQKLALAMAEVLLGS